MRLPLTVAFSLLALAAPDGAALDVAVLAHADVGAAVSRAPWFAPGVQTAISAGGSIEFLAPEGAGAGLGLDYESVAPSAMHDLVSYRGYQGARVEAYGVWFPRGASARGASDLAAGIRAGLTGAFLRYVHTGIYFVVPGVRIEPFVSIRPAAAPWLAMEIGMPLVLVRRADLGLAGSAALSLAVGVRGSTASTRRPRA
jgi:hypothetical protein